MDGRPQITPRDIPPLVSQHLATIMPAAREKMFNAELVIRRSPGEAINVYAYPNVEREIRANWTHMLPIMRVADTLTTLTYPINPKETGRPPTFKALVGEVTAETLLAAIKPLTWLTPDYFAPDLAYIQEITETSAVDSWVLIAPQPQGLAAELEGLGTRAAIPRIRREGRGGLFGEISEPKHRKPAEGIVGTRPSWGDPFVDRYAAQKTTGAVLLYPVVETRHPRPKEPVVGAFVLFAPASAVPSNGLVVQFRVRNNRRSSAAIVDITRS